MPDTRGVLIGLVSIIMLCGVVLYSIGHHPSHESLDFIERHLGFSPDGGDGSMEILILIVLAMIVAAIGVSLRALVK
jgi:hypothetical protein